MKFYETRLEKLMRESVIQPLVHTWHILWLNSTEISVLEIFNFIRAYLYQQVRLVQKESFLCVTKENT